MSRPRPLSIVYIAGAISGPDSWTVEQNVRRAEERSFEVWKVNNLIPLCPHITSRIFPDSLIGRARAIDATREMLRRCDALLTVSGWEASVGAKDEVQFAIKQALPVFHRLSDLAEWAETGQHPGSETI